MVRDLGSECLEADTGWAGTEHEGAALQSSWMWGTQGMDGPSVQGPSEAAVT
jgi:hypothetical protein